MNAPSAYVRVLGCVVGSSLLLSGCGAGAAPADESDTSPDTASLADSPISADGDPKDSNLGDIGDSGTRDDAVVDDTTVADVLVDSSVTDTASTDVGSTGTSPMVGPCRLYPPDNPWNTDVSKSPLRADGARFLATMNTTRKLHPDWGTWTDKYGIPWQTGTGAAPVKMTWSESWGRTESDKLPCTGSDFCYPIPSTVKIEGGPGATTGSDRHVLYVDTAGAPNNCTLYELYNTQNWTGPGWTAANGAIFKLGSNALRTEGWTSADAAGLPILPGLVRFEEVNAGVIRHAIRFTMARSAQAYIHPATHAAGVTGAFLPPMGLRLRLKATFDPGTVSAESKVIIQAMKTYGLILADNGSDWYFTGDSDDRWGPLMDGILTAFNKVHGSDFEVVDTGPLIIPPP